MNTTKIAAALNTLSLGIAELAEGLSDGTQAVPVAHSPIPEPLPFADEVSEIFPDEGSLAQCPKHRLPYTAGQYGPYCSEITNDPAWGKQKGDRLWCRISPKNAAEWLRVTA